MQHSACGGTSEAAFSPSGIVAGRWKTHRLSWESTAAPPTCPVTHLFGNVCDQSGSGSNCGTWVLLGWAVACVRMTMAHPANTRTLCRIVVSFVEILAGNSSASHSIKIDLLSRRPVGIY